MEEIPSGGKQPSLCVAYFLLTGTSGWALKQVSASGSPYAIGTFSFLLGHSILGFIHATHPDAGETVKAIVQQTTILAELAPLALMNAELYFLTGYSKEYEYAHVATAVIPFVAEFASEENTATVLDVAILANLASMLYLQISNETGVWMGGLFALTALNHFLFKQVAAKYEVPRVEIVTIGLSFFAVFSIFTLKELRAI